eukprot:42247_1
MDPSYMKSMKYEICESDANCEENCACDTSTKPNKCVGTCAERQPPKKKKYELCDSTVREPECANGCTCKPDSGTPAHASTRCMPNRLRDPKETCPFEDRSRYKSESCTLATGDECKEGCGCGMRDGRQQCFDDLTATACPEAAGHPAASYSFDAPDQAHEALYDGLFDDSDYAPISQWTGHNDYDDGVNIDHSAHSMRMDFKPHNFDEIHREMALGALGLLVITCCLFACCIIVWSAFLYVFKQSDDNKRHSAPSYDVVPSDHSQV